MLLNGHSNDLGKGLMGIFTFKKGYLNLSHILTVHFLSCGATSINTVVYVFICELWVRVSQIFSMTKYTVQIVYTGQSTGARLYGLCTLIRALPSHTATVLSLSVVEYMCTHSYPWGKTVPEEASQPVIIYNRSLHMLGQWLVINITYNTVNNRKGIFAWVSMLQLYAHPNQE